MTHCNMIHISEDLRAPVVIVKIIKWKKDFPCFRNLEIFINNTVIAYAFLRKKLLLVQNMASEAQIPLTLKLMDFLGLLGDYWYSVLTLK